MRLPLIFVIATTVIDSMGIGLILPVMPALLREVSNIPLADAALYGGVLVTAFALMQFIFGPVIGSLSDRYGRRPVMLISLLVMALDYIVMALAGAFWVLLVGRMVGGIAAATQSTAAAFMADISKPEEKAARFGMIGAAFGMGFVFGPLLGGLLAEFGTRAPFYAAAALAATNLPAPTRSARSRTSRRHRNCAASSGSSSSIRSPSWSIPPSGPFSPKNASAGARA